MSTVTCPKCLEPMRAYERAGITIDQCTGCRGVFLDRGELDRLIDAEAASAPPPAPPVAGARRDDWDRRDRDDHRRDDDRSWQQRPKKKKGFLSELFDD